ncbi:MAG: 2-succinyl-5-enolpyruvyl-6-hydroxy-3-cyclohexene-1-carboxylic-acid synthase [Prochlorococcaceae cyanobacterium]
MAPELNAPTPEERNLQAALWLLEALQAGGLALVVVAPGSRSAPLAQAAALLHARGLPLLTCIDERSAGFFALGWAKATGRPAAVITTSGTAVANLLPAAVEADWGCVPLLLLTADRPAHLKNCGANQTVNQQDFLQAAVRWLGQGEPAGLGAMSHQALLELAHKALLACCGSAAAAPGGVHLNLPFDEPLHIDQTQWQQQALRQQGLHQQDPQQLGPPPTDRAAEPQQPDPLPPQMRLDPDQRGLVIAGPWRGTTQSWQPYCEALRRWLTRSGWPLLADGLSGLRGHQALQTVGGYDLLLQEPPAKLRAAQVLRLGPLPASRRLQIWLKHCGGKQVLISEGDSRNLDPLGTATGQWSGGLASWCAAQGASWQQGEAVGANLDLRAQWHRADAELQQWLDQQLSQQQSLSEPALARQLSLLLPADLPLVLANSSPVRDWESFAASDGPPRAVIGFRGASGIDGTLSSACGVAEALGQAVLLTGDLALLHDCNGWLWQRQLRGQLAVVLINNGGGGIFEQLPIRHPEASPAASGPAMDFERLFAMPQSVDTALLCAAHGVPHRSLRRLDELGSHMDWLLQQPLAVLEVHTDRRADAALRQRLRTMASKQWSG